MKYERFLKNYTDYIFVEDQPEKADIIFVPGNGFPQMAEHAAFLWKEGYAPWILPSGRYSIAKGKFMGVRTKQEIYNGNYETEWEFLKDVLLKNGVEEQVILKEEQATYTYQNAIFSRQVTDAKELSIKKAIICCKAQHARRCKLYYQLLYPEATLLMCVSDTGINRENWYQTEEGVKDVLGEMERCSGQFQEIFKEIVHNC